MTSKTGLNINLLLWNLRNFQIQSFGKAWNSCQLVLAREFIDKELEVLPYFLCLGLRAFSCLCIAGEPLVATSRTLSHYTVHSLPRVPVLTNVSVLRVSWATLKSQVLTRSPGILEHQPYMHWNWKAYSSPLWAPILSIVVPSLLHVSKAIGGWRQHLGVNWLFQAHTPWWPGITVGQGTCRYCGVESSHLSRSWHPRHQPFL